MLIQLTRYDGNRPILVETTSIICIEREEGEPSTYIECVDQGELDVKETLKEIMQQQFELMHPGYATE